MKNIFIVLVVLAALVPGLRGQSKTHNSTVSSSSRLTGAEQLAGPKEKKQSCSNGYLALAKILERMEDNRNSCSCSSEELKALKEDLKATKEDLAATKEDLAATKEDLAAWKARMTAEILNTLNNTIQEAATAAAAAEINTLKEQGFTIANYSNAYYGKNCP